jgi:hypothetical protein
LEYRDVVETKQRQAEASSVVAISHWRAFPRARVTERPFPTVLLVALAIELLVAGAVAMGGAGGVLPIVPALVISGTSAGLAYINGKLLVRWRDRAFR